ncbi:MAG TPA: HDOD domain-containing protein [Capillimicrobium sp.]|nr:HDOD domain-containing protein [Capillimicrobium sp.]
MEATQRATDGARWRDAVDPKVEDRLAAAIDELAQLPVLDATVTRILSAVDDPDSNAADLVAVLESDATFSANLLRFANSAARAHPIRAKTIRQAVMLVGRRALRQLALETATFRFLEEAPGTGASRGELHVHAISVAAAASAAADRLGVTGDVPHLAALLHDVGKLVLPLAFGEEACDEIAREHPHGPDRALAERERLGVDHAAAGALLAERWNLPEGVPEAIALHHGGPSGLASPEPTIAVVQLANELQRLLVGGGPDHALLDVALERCEADPTILDELARHALPAGAALPEAGALGRQVADVDGLSQTDDLTGVANRRHWLQTTRAALAERGAGAIVVCAVDGLDQVEARHGVRVADTVLGEVARVMALHGRVGRLGGERFGLWVPAGDAAAADSASAIEAELGATLGGAGDVAATVALGTAAAPRDGADLSGLLDAAAARVAAQQGAKAARVATDRSPIREAVAGARPAPPELRPPSRSASAGPGAHRGSHPHPRAEAARVPQEHGPRIIPARPF